MFAVRVLMVGRCHDIVPIVYRCMDRLRGLYYIVANGPSHGTGSSSPPFASGLESRRSIPTPAYWRVVLHTMSSEAFSVRV